VTTSDSRYLPGVARRQRSKTMNTYIKNAAGEFYAVRDHHTRVRAALPDGTEIVPASKKLRELARCSAIPTVRVMADGRLGHL